MITFEAIIIVCGWLVSLAVALFAVPRIAAKRVCQQFGLTQVQQGGETLFAVQGPDGEAVKVPIGVKEGKDGEQEIVWGYAGLGYTLPYLAADMAAQKVKMGLLNTKSQISKKLGADALKSGMIDEMMPFLPKKVQAAVAIAKALGLGSSVPVGAQTGGQTGQHTPSGKAI